MRLKMLSVALSVGLILPGCAAKNNNPDVKMRPSPEAAKAVNRYPDSIVPAKMVGSYNNQTADRLVNLDIKPSDEVYGAYLFKGGAKAHHGKVKSVSGNTLNIQFTDGKKLSVYYDAENKSLLDKTRSFYHCDHFDRVVQAVTKS